MIRVADLFCGAGGASTGFLQAATKQGVSVDLVAVNHWPIAVQTHTQNHPAARHFCQSIETLDPEVAVPGRKLDLLIAAPECVHFSTARGGRPMSDQSRASAWHLLRWLEVLRVEHVLIENVPEFQTWGPLAANGRPMVSKKGNTFRAFISALESLNYRVEYRVLNAADYGAVTTRRRLFLQARRGNKPIIWPRQTHSRTGGRDLFGGLKKWRGAREVIDWTLKSESIFDRKRPLKPATIRRIIAGLEKFGGEGLKPFIVQLTHGGRTSSVDVPLQTVTVANRGELGVAQPFIVPYHAERDGQSARTHAIDQPLPVVPTSNVFGLVEPVVVTLRNNDRGQSVDSPIDTITAGGTHHGLIEPFIVPPRGFSQTDRKVDDVDEPLRTITAVAGHTFGLVEAVVEPFMLGQQSGATPRAVSDPVPTVSTDGAISVVEPFHRHHYDQRPVRPGTASPSTGWRSISVSGCCSRTNSPQLCHSPRATSSQGTRASKSSRSATRLTCRWPAPSVWPSSRPTGTARRSHVKRRSHEAPSTFHLRPRDRTRIHAGPRPRRDDGGRSLKPRPPQPHAKVAHIADHRARAVND